MFLNQLCILLGALTGIMLLSLQWVASLLPLALFGREELIAIAGKVVTDTL